MNDDRAVDGSNVTSPARRFESSWVAASAVLTSTAAAFLVANLACALMLSRAPSLLATEEQKLKDEVFDRLAMLDAARLRQWMAIDNQDDLRALRAERDAIRAEAVSYEDFTEVRPVPWHGRFFNVTEAGYRKVANQGPWPPSGEFYNVFLFGGSAAAGSIAPDWGTIASAMQAQLVDRRINARPIRLYNFARGGYFSTQERILFQELLLHAFIPDAAIFLDGANDFYFLGGRPSGWEYFDEAIHNTMGAVRRSSSGGLDGIDFAAFGRACRSLPIVKAARVVRRKFFRHPPATVRPEPATRAQLDGVLDRYLEKGGRVDPKVYAGLYFLGRKRP